MEEIGSILDSYANQAFEDEDGASITIKRNIGASADEQDAFMEREKIVLPKELKELLMYSNGMDLFGISLLSLEEMIYYGNEKLLVFHNWGNGDFDSILLDQKNKNFGSVYFMNHSPDKIYLVSPSITDWVKNVIHEVQQKGTLYHPCDYVESGNGLYGHITEFIDH